MGKTYNFKTAKPTQIKRNVSVEGETIETKVERIVRQKEPIKDGAPLIYTERKDGVNPAYNIKTDRFEVAVETMDLVQKNAIAKREAKMSIVPKDNTEPTGTDTTN